MEPERPAGDDPHTHAAHPPLGLGAVNWHTGETLVITRHHKRRREVAELLQALLDHHRDKTVYVAWDNASTHEDEELEAVLRGDAGRLVLLYLPTYSPWLNPMEMLWRQFRREVTHCELFGTLQDLLTATRAFFDRATTVRVECAPSLVHIPHEFRRCT